MRRLPILILVGWLVLAGSGAAAPVLSNLLDMNEYVRQRIAHEDILSLPDSSLNLFIAGALAWVSTEVGGLEAQIRIMTVNGQPFYAVPDTTVAVIEAELHSQNGTIAGLKSWPAAFYNDAFGISQLEGGGIPTGAEDESLLPLAYKFWADSVELYPYPVIDDDTLILKILLEHPSITADTHSVRLISTFTKAAALLACQEALMSLDEYEKAAVFGELFDKAVVKLRERYNRPFDILPPALDIEQ